MCSVTMSGVSRASLTQQDSILPPYLLYLPLLPWFFVLSTCPKRSSQALSKVKPDSLTDIAGGKRGEEETKQNSLRTLLLKDFSLPWRREPPLEKILQLFNGCADLGEGWLSDHVKELASSKDSLAMVPTPISWRRKFMLHPEPETSNFSFCLLEIPSPNLRAR